MNEAIELLKEIKDLLAMIEYTQVLFIFAFALAKLADWR